MNFKQEDSTCVVEVPCTYVHHVQSITLSAPTSPLKRTEVLQNIVLAAGKVANCDGTWVYCSTQVLNTFCAKGRLSLHLQAHRHSRQ